MKDKIKQVVDKITPGKAEDDKPHGPITEGNIEEHREKALESGRKFKYPLHIARHKILINAAIVFVVALIAFVGLSWWMLYRVQDTSDFYYTATRIIPVPVANVDGQDVPYGDYMRRVRASIYYLEKQDNRDLSTEDGRRELEHTRRYNMDEAERIALAYKIAGEKKLSINDEEVEANIQATLDAGAGGSISLKAYENSLRRYFGWSLDDYRHIVRDRLILRAASFAIDDAARERVNEAKRRLNIGEDFAAVAGQVSDDDVTKARGGDAGVVSVDNVDRDGLIAVARTLNIGQISDIIEGVDAFYIIKLTEKTDTTVKYSMIKINLGEFSKRFEQLKTDGKITEYIEIQGE
ncbi:hypothetical protein FACS189431_4170 [Alphaproteobacteria bacterium]|nr:hypothetical protein FACS189431_4170 [Alphaproteobacteria bacterium]